MSCLKDARDLNGNKLPPPPGINVYPPNNWMRRLLYWMHAPRRWIRRI